MAEDLAPSDDDPVDPTLAEPGAHLHRRAPAGVGASLRRRRLAAGMSLREFAKVLGVSASFISQLENGKSQPSVTTLFMICHALDVTVDEIFNESERAAAHDGAADHRGRGSGRSRELDVASTKARAAESRPGPVVWAAERRRLVLDTGVVWEQLSALREPDSEFLLITYDVGGSSAAGEHLSRRSGTDYGFVLSGELEVTLGFDRHTLRQGDSIAFDSSTPHRLANRGTVPARAVWFAQGGQH